MMNKYKCFKLLWLHVRASSFQYEFGIAFLKELYLNSKFYGAVL